MNASYDQSAIQRLLNGWDEFLPGVRFDDYEHANTPHFCPSKNAKDGMDAKTIRVF